MELPLSIFRRFTNKWYLGSIWTSSAAPSATRYVEDTVSEEDLQKKHKIKLQYSMSALR